MARDYDVRGMADKCVENHVNFIGVLFTQAPELIAAVKKYNGVKSDERRNAVDILVDPDLAQVHIVERQCFEKRGIYRREHTKNIRVLGDSEGFEAGHLEFFTVVYPRVEATAGFNGKVCQGWNR